MKQFNLLTALTLMVVMTFMLFSCEEEEMADLTTPALEAVENTEAPALQSLFTLPDEAKRWSEEQLKDYVRGVHNAEIPTPESEPVQTDLQECFGMIAAAPACPLQLIIAQTLYVIITPETLYYSGLHFDQSPCVEQFLWSFAAYSAP